MKIIYSLILIFPFFIASLVCCCLNEASATTAGEGRGSALAIPGGLGCCDSNVPAGCSCFQEAGGIDDRGLANSNKILGPHFSATSAILSNLSGPLQYAPVGAVFFLDSFARASSPALFIQYRSLRI